MAADKRAPGTDPRSFGLSPQDLRALGYRVGQEGDSNGDSKGPPVDEPPGSPERPTRSRPRDTAWRWALATALPLLVVAWGASPRRGLPDPVPAGAPATEFSSARAMAQLVEIARLPRPVGSPEHARVRDRLVQRFSSLGLETEVQTGSAQTSGGGQARVLSATVRNVVARLPGTAPDEAGVVLLTAPYDGGSATPAASAGAFGLAVIVEAVRALDAGPPLQPDVVVALTDAGQLQALGAQAFAEHRWAQDVRSVVAVGAEGGSGPAYAFGSGAGTTTVASEASEAPPRMAGSSSLSRVLGPRVEAPTDAPAVLPPDASRSVILALGDRSLAGQPGDTPEHVDERTLQHAGEQVLALVRGAGDPVTVDPEVSFTLPFAGTVGYPEAWIVWITVSLWLAVGLLVALLRYRGASWKGLGGGLLAGVLPVALSVWCATLLLRAVTPMHDEHGWLHGVFWRDDLHVGALLALAVAWVGSAQAIARRWVRRDVLALGALAAPLAVCLWLTVRTPTAAYAAQWPLAIACVATATLAFTGPRRSDGPIVWAAVLALSAAALALMVPNLELATATLTLREAGTLGLLFATAAAVLVPTLDRLLGPRSWWLPALSAGVAAALLVAATPGATGSARHPELSTLVYLADEPASLLSEISGGLVDEPDAVAPRRMTGAWLTVPGAGEEWARSWVAEAKPGARLPGPLYLPREDLYEVAGAGPTSTLAPPVVEIVLDSVSTGRRIVHLRVRSGLGGEMLTVALADEVDGELIAIDGAPLVGDPRPTRVASHWGTAPDADLLVDVSVGREEAALGLVVVEHHLRPLALLGEGYFERPDWIIPNQALGSDRVIQRTALRLPLTRTGPTF